MLCMKSACSEFRYIFIKFERLSQNQHDFVISMTEMFTTLRVEIVCERNCCRIYFRNSLSETCCVCGRIFLQIVSTFHPIFHFFIFFCIKELLSVYFSCFEGKQYLKKGRLLLLKKENVVLDISRIKKDLVSIWKVSKLYQVLFIYLKIMIPC